MTKQNKQFLIESIAYTLLAVLCFALCISLATSCINTGAITLGEDNESDVNHLPNRSVDLSAFNEDCEEQNEL